MKTLLICAAGMSTSLLVQNMEKVAEEGDYIEAISINELEKRIEEFDVVLVGPQIRFKFPKIEKVVKEHGKKAELIDAQAYGTMNGKAVYDQAVALYKK